MFRFLIVIVATTFGCGRDDSMFRRALDAGRNTNQTFSSQNSSSDSDNTSSDAYPRAGEKDSVREGYEGKNDFRTVTADRSVPGVDTPIKIDPTVQITGAMAARDFFKLFLNRNDDGSGTKAYTRAYPSIGSVDNLAQYFLGSAEFAQNPSLRDKTGYIKRLYQLVLKRDPSSSELSILLGGLREANGSGTGSTWAQLYQQAWGLAEAKKANCHDSYYSYGRKLSQDSYLLDDLFNGRAKLLGEAEAEKVTIRFNDQALKHTGMKISSVYSKAAGSYIGFVRAAKVRGDGYEHINIYAVESKDKGKTWVQIGTDSLFPENSGSSYFDYLDPQVTIDYSVCPAQTIMAFECAHPGFAQNSLCVSTSTTPEAIESWSPPAVVVAGVTNNSASTGVALADGKRKFLSWTELNFGLNTNLSVTEGIEGVSSKLVETSNFFAALGDESQYPNSYILRAEHDSRGYHNINCTSSWDCNNKDKQDAKVENGKYYLIYNGANYYLCGGRSDGGINQWGISIARSSSPTGAYSEQLKEKDVIKAKAKNTCGVAYPTVNEIDGQLFMYYISISEDNVITQLRTPLKAK